jgi:hypothetical protein
VSTDSANFKVQGKYIDRKYSWYFNTAGLLTSRRDNPIYGFGIGTTAEFKFWDSHSLSPGLNFYYMRTNWLVAQGSHYMRLSLDLSYRYYYNLKSRMSKGLTGNNFCANYILVKPFFLFNYEPYETESYWWDFDKGEWVIKSVKKFKVEPVLYLGYGLQRNLGNRFTIDVNGGLMFSNSMDFSNPLSSFYLQLNLRYLLK